MNKNLETTLPPDLRKALAAEPGVTELWKNLTPIARRDFISWIESAKQAATRSSRIARVGSMLTSGKRRPCCYAIVPMNLYKALGANAKAKTQWSTLTPMERRDFISWIDAVEQSEARKGRIEKVCAMLAVGKKRAQ